ncbi:MAG: hypothetical protein M0P71_11925 [Melioribacteraceae bacterium]|jgi:hypothetical protein|nr:hypothetical protein [Melioribacteraceae bacterium]
MKGHFEKKEKKEIKPKKIIGIITVKEIRAKIQTDKSEEKALKKYRDRYPDYDVTFKPV